MIYLKVLKAIFHEYLWSSYGLVGRGRLDWPLRRKAEIGRGLLAGSRFKVCPEATLHFEYDVVAGRGGVRQATGRSGTSGGWSRTGRGGTRAWRDEAWQDG